MTSVFASEAAARPIPRARSTMAASAVIHAAAIGALVTFAGAAASVSRPRPDTHLTFVQVLPLPVNPPVRLPALPKERLKVVQTPAPRVEPPPVPERVLARREPTPPAPAPAPEVAMPVPQPKAQPTVKVGAFDTAETARPSEARVLQTAGFDAAAARTVGMKTGGTTVGAFDREAGLLQSGAARGKVVADVGFGGSTVGDGGKGTRTGGVVADAGFGGGGASGAGGRGGSGTVVSGGFDATQTKPVAPLEVRRAPTEVPLEILSKPTPAYTDEARARKIEGEVLLEVEFAAHGEIRVLRVVRGLGHGLDEAAMRAVQNMRFKPAQRDGQPVDMRTTVNIVFRLA